MPSATSLSKVLPLKTTFRYSNEYPRSFIDKDQMKICDERAHYSVKWYNMDSTASIIMRETTFVVLFKKKFWVWISNAKDGL
ncbi:predicted protein [Lichtheimia corymbifera JMRC:FSU:9682]|uniref:Uncharacterized protein n=1 Tax=Lichtheimia corymbifera JMRC:FSU:9682 TaxID=1263082 RepID=A0A068S7F5_9FUNG|nr:predicted protein [Lichtheimia corymbifera JMRC:FSU:9682]